VSLRVVVLVSGEGTILQALLDARADPSFKVEIVAVGSDRQGARGLARAEAAGVSTFVEPLEGDRGAWDVALAARVAEFSPDLVILAGFMRLVGPSFLARFGGRTLNTHPSLLPAFPGMHAVRDALAHGVTITGCTLFYIDDGVDTGPILAQRAVEILPSDDEAALHARIRESEREMMVCEVARLAASSLDMGRSPRT
jgi:formyltetrahydrofolate-dependent phosphoribosylglycinamide formyltransferase